MHSTDNLEDGYLGSGKILGYSISKHGKENHLKEILEHCSSRDELKKREKEIVNEELLADKLCLNIKVGGEGGGPSWDKLSPESRFNQYLGKKKRVGTKISEEHKLKIANANRNKVRTAEMRKRISDGHKKRDPSTYASADRSNSMWINNGSKRKFIKCSNFYLYELEGFHRGYSLKRTDESL